MFEVYYEDGGTVPAALAGRYTRAQYAKEAIDKYKANKGA